jgi:small-conductance mechanosensitive channel
MGAGRRRRNHDPDRHFGRAQRHQAVARPDRNHHRQHAIVDLDGASSRRHSPDPACAIRLASRVINHSIARTRGLDATQQLLAQKLAGVALLVAAFFIGIDIIGIDLTAFAVFSGAFGLAVGFGLQKTFGNLIAGIILLMDRSIKPGDVIVVGDSFGHVTKIGVRAVSVVTRDGKEHLIPNENLMTQEVENWSYSSKDVRIHIPVGISYEADLPLAQKLMVEAARASKRVLANPAPTVWLRAFGESSVDHEILAWISDPEGGVGNVQSEVLNRLWLLFKENGIALPYPQRDIHVKDWPGPPPLEKQ